MLCVVDDADWLDREVGTTWWCSCACRLLAERVGVVFGTRYALPQLDKVASLDVTGLRERAMHIRSCATPCCTGRWTTKYASASSWRPRANLLLLLSNGREARRPPT